MNRFLMVVLSLFFLTGSGFSQDIKSAILPEERRLELYDLAVKVKKNKSSKAVEIADSLKGLGNNDYEKAYLLFCWIADNIAYDTASYFSGVYKNTSAEATFAAGMSVCEGYAGLMVLMGNRMGLDVKKVSGYAKGYAYKPGYVYKSSNHAWNIVRIDSRDFLVDSTWGAGSVSGKTFKKNFKEYYFFTAPELFVLSHLPVDDNNQLLEQKITKSEFESWPEIDYQLLSAGADPVQIYKMLEEPGKAVFPEGLDAKSKVIRMLNVPLEGHQKVGNNFQIEVSNPAAEKGAILYNGAWTIVDMPEGIMKSEVALNAAGTLTVMFKYSGSTSYWSWLKYKVVK